MGGVRKSRQNTHVHTIVRTLVVLGEKECKTKHWWPTTSISARYTSYLHLLNAGLGTYSISAVLERFVPFFHDQGYTFQSPITYCLLERLENLLGYFVLSNVQWHAEYWMSKKCFLLLSTLMNVFPFFPFYTQILQIHSIPFTLCALAQLSRVMAVANTDKKYISMCVYIYIYINISI